MLVGIFALAFAAGNTVKYYLDLWKADRAVKSFQSAIDAIYKNDTYGGKTPEETFDLYLAALKKGDLELARKYFVVERRKIATDELLEMKTNNQMADYIKELGSISKQAWVKKEGNDGIDIRYSAVRFMSKDIQAVDDSGVVVNKKLLPGEYSSTMSFKKTSNLWKLYLI